jgi:hypothetical protein
MVVPCGLAAVSYPQRQRFGNMVARSQYVRFDLTQSVRTARRKTGYISSIGGVVPPLIIGCAYIYRMLS